MATLDTQENDNLLNNDMYVSNASISYNVFQLPSNMTHSVPGLPHNMTWISNQSGEEEPDYSNIPYFEVVKVRWYQLEVIVSKFWQKMELKQQIRPKAYCNVHFILGI